MAAAKDKDPKDKGDDKQSQKTQQGYSIKPKDATPGEIRSLLEIAKEFSNQQVKVNFYDTPHARILDVRADSPSRAKFIEYLLQRIRDHQHGLEHLLDIKPSPEHGYHPEAFEGGS